MSYVHSLSFWAKKNTKIINYHMIMKKRYLSPVTNVVETFGPESSILYNSYIMKNVYVDELENIDGDAEFFGEEAEKPYFEF